MKQKLIISGGGTGGHIFPALSIAHEIKRRAPEAEILFVGARGGMELSIVPQYGFPIEAVWISGIHRQLTIRNVFRNLLFPVKLITSLLQAGRIVSRFQPQMVVGVGGFASAPIGRVASGRGIPLYLCEQNAFPGLVNRWLASRARKILLGNADASKYFEKEKVVVTGNPVRAFPERDRADAIRSFGLDPEKPTLLSLGGSLGAQSINEALAVQHPQLLDAGIQFIWQCGKRYYESLKASIPEHPQLRLIPFIDDMVMAFAAADLVISRAGGSTTSELIAASKPALLVPSPNVAEDHQTKNALSLADKGAAIMITDAEAKTKLISEALAILSDQQALERLQHNIEAMEKHDAAREIVDQLFEDMDT